MTIFQNALLATLLAACGGASGNINMASEETDSVSNQTCPITEECDSFVFEKYHQAFLDGAELFYIKPEEAIRLTSYALIDIDKDGKQEVWVRSDEGQNFQGVYAIDGDSVILLSFGDTCTDLLFYENAVGYNGYFSEGNFVAGATVVKDSKPAGSYQRSGQINVFSEEQEVIDEHYSINHQETDSASCAAFSEKLGETYSPDVEWHPIHSSLFRMFE